MNQSVASSQFSPAAIMLAFLILFLFLSFLLQQDDDNNEPLPPIVITTGEWAPYSGERLPRNGTAAAVVRTVLRRMGYQPEFKFMPWERALDVARLSESNDGVRASFPYIRTDERDAEFYYSESVADVETSLFINASRHGAADISSLADLSAFRIIPIEGYSYPDKLSRYIASDIEPLATHALAFRYLLEHVDQDLVVAEATSVARDLLREGFQNELNAIAKANLTFHEPTCLIASKLNPHNKVLIAEFNRILAELRAEGGVEQLHNSVARAIEQASSVALVPPRPGEMIKGYVDMNLKESVLLPRGSRAIIERWGKAYLEVSVQEDAADGWVKVKVINGPSAGKIFYVEGLSVQLP